MKLLNRRWFLKALFALGLSPLLPRVLFGAPSESLFFRNMEALTNAIMPDTEGLGIYEKLREAILKRAETARLCAAGLEAMERYSRQKYGKSFHSLEETQKENVLRWMDGIPREEFQGFFFMRFRETVLAVYYTSPEVWKTLRYNGPPQPRGFIDYYLPPEGTNE